MRRPAVLVLLGPTGVGKTELSLTLARRLGAHIVSADSRQVFREIPIGTAAPTLEERATVPHYLVGHKSVVEPYSAGMYEQEALEVIGALHRTSPWVVVSGGSMMYIDALTEGTAPVPDVSLEVRQAVWERYRTEGLETILGELSLLDPLCYARVDKRNYKRVLHGYEVCLSSGKPFSSFLSEASRAERPFDIIKVGLSRPRPELYERINRRVELMIQAGLVEEARAVYQYRDLNALNTVGYKELFAYFDGAIDLPETVRLIQRNSRHYARKQMTWWQRDEAIHWFHPDDVAGILSLINAQTP